MKNYLLILSLFVALGAASAPSDARQIRPDMTASRLAEVRLTTPGDAKLIHDNGGIIDHRTGDMLEVYLLEADFNRLRDLGLDLRWIPDTKSEYLRELWAITGGTDNPLADYHTNNEIQSQLAAWQAGYPNLIHYESIGNSVQGRPLWVAKVSDNVSTDEAEIEVKYVGTMHGNEPVGTENIMSFIEECLTQYGTDSEITELVNDFEMWFLPMMNPDGNVLSQRWNANGVDLNRDFPDRIQDSVNTTAGRQIEVAHMMNWSASRNFVLSANFHTGSLVVNYPFDSNTSGNFVDTPTPEDAHFEYISRRYSQYNNPMYTNPEFQPFGITNGADWYVIYGGMQDWNYVWMGDKEVTIELSYTFVPDTNQLPQLWQNNRLSMRYYFLEAKYGIRGIVTDSLTGEPLGASVRLGNNPYLTYSSNMHGEYYRILLNGTYNLTFTAAGYQPKTVSGIVVAGGVPTILNVQLSRLPSAEIAVNPDSIYAELEECDSIEVPLTIENIGSLSLDWAAAEAYVNPGGYGSATGGGWRFIDSDQAGGPAYNWVNIQSLGQAIAFTQDDQNLGPYNIGFSFPFYGQSFSAFRVSANGWISFTSSATGANSYNNTFLPNSSTAPENLVAAWWDDLSPQRAGSSVRYYSNNLDSLVISFTNVQSYANNGLYNFELILLSSGKVKFQYASMGVNRLTSSTIGLQNSTRTKGTTVVYNNTYIHDNLAIEFCPNSMVELIPASGTVMSGGTQNVTAHIRACCLPDGISTGFIRLTSNDLTDPVVLLPVTVNVGVLMPDAVSDLTILPDGAQVRLQWSASENALSYNVYGSNTFPVDPVPGNMIGFTASTEFVADPLLPAMFYCVTAVR